MVQKIMLKPTSKELVYRTDDRGIFFDVFSYSGTNAQEKSLGSLFLVGHIKYDEKEDLSYVLSLVAALAKREFYSAQSIKMQDPKKAFESSLKKLNEVLEDFFENKNFSLNIGLVATSGEQIYISRLGKFKVALARDGEYIDVLNNLLLFEKSTDTERQFSNVISGKLKPSDTIFAYFPNRNMTLREKKLNPLLIKNDNASFLAELETASKSSKNFVCCGVLVSMGEVKEIPITSAPSYDMMKNSSLSVRAASSDSDDAPEADDDSPIVQTPGARKTSSSTPKDQEMPIINASDLSVTKKPSAFGTIARHVSKLGSINSMSTRGRTIAFASVAAIVLLPLFLIILIRAASGPNFLEIAVDTARIDYENAKIELRSGDVREARNLLGNALAQLSDFQGEKEPASLTKEIVTTLDDLNKTSSINIELYFEYVSLGSADLANITIFDGQPFAIDDLGRLIDINDEAEVVHDFNVIPAQLHSTSTRIAALNADYSLSVYNVETTNTGLFEPEKIDSPVDDTELYEGNLYVLSDNNIYKYANASKGDTEHSQWLQDNLRDNLISIAIDGSIFGLTSNGSIIKFFKGEKDSSFDVDFVPETGAMLTTIDGSENIYIIEKTAKRVFVFDKDSERFLKSYRLDTPQPIQDVAIDIDDSIWVLSDNTIYIINQ